MGRVRERAAAQISSQKDRATDGLGSVAHAVRQSSQQLREQQHDAVASFIEQAADQVERWSRRLKEKDVGELVEDAQRLARRQPALFVGSAFALGLLGARFFKSSPTYEERYGYGGTGAAYGGSSRGSDYQTSLPSSAASTSTTAGSTREYGSRGTERF